MLYICVTSITIGFHLNGISSAKQNSHEMQEILNETPEIEVDCLQVVKNEVVENGVSIEKVPLIESKNLPKSASIAFKNVHFAYPTRPDIEVKSFFYEKSTF
jgi:ABC-type multidrug transport system fused ATPase/permease subunit